MGQGSADVYRVVCSVQCCNLVSVGISVGKKLAGVAKDAFEGGGALWE